MAGKDNTARSGRSDAVHVFRQFAWNLAGTLAGAKAGTQRAPARPRPAKPSARR